MKRAEALHSRAALIIRNAGIVNRQRSASASPGKENRRSGRARVARRHLFSDDFIWTETLEHRDNGQHSSTIVQSVLQPSPPRVTELCHQQPPSSVPAMSTDQGQPTVELTDGGQHSSTIVQSVLQPSPPRVTELCHQEPPSSVPAVSTDQGQPTVEFTDGGQHSLTVVQRTRNTCTEYGQQSAAIQLTDSTGDQISMFTFSDMSLSLTDFQGSFILHELSPACLERNLTSTPLSLKKPDAANNGITETPVNSTAIQESPICNVFSEVPVTSELQQAGQMLGPFSLLLQAADALWQDPPESSAQPSLLKVAAGASNQQHMQSVVHTTTMQPPPANHQTRAKNRQQRTKKSETPAVPPKQTKPNTRQRCKRKNNSPPSAVIRDIPSGSEDSALSSSEEGDEHQKLTSTQEVHSSSSHQQKSDDQSRKDRNQNHQKFRNKWKTAKLNKTPESVHFCGSSHPVDETLVYPIDYFRHYFTDELISEIASQSTLYSVQVKPEKPTKISTVDIERFMGICLYTSLVRLSYIRNYWSTEFRIAQVADTLTLNRFEDV